MTVPEELHWVNTLLARRGLSGTLQLLEAWCHDTADRTHDEPVAHQWRACAGILEDAVKLVQRVEPAQGLEEEGDNGG